MSQYDPEEEEAINRCAEEMERALDEARVRTTFRRSVATIRLSARESLRWSGPDLLTIAGHVELLLREFREAGMPPEHLEAFRRRHGL